MVEHAAVARCAEIQPSRPASKFPLWAGDVPVTDAEAQPAGFESPCFKVDASRAAPQTCVSISELAARKRQVTPPPLPKATAKLASPPVEIVAPPGPQPARNDAGGPALVQQPAEIDLPQLRLAPSFAERGQQLPCWLTSLVLHLCLVIVLNSYVVYVGGYYSGGTSSTGSPRSITCVTTGSLEVALDGSPDVAPEIGMTELTLFEPSPAEIELVRPTPAGIATADEVGVPVAPGVPVAIEMPQDGETKYFEGAVDLSLDDSPAESSQAPQPRRRSRHGQQESDPATTTRAVPPIDQVPSPAADAAQPPVAERVKDAIVNEFIEYDLGHLRGEEAARALREFQSLRPDSIPSLVRGLNRAARIAGTCPVMVLSRKLEEMLRETSDPAMIRYAFENLGRDVPKTAAHYHRIEGLRQQLLARQKQQVAGALEQQGIAADDMLLGRMAPLFTAGADRLNKALGDPNAVIRQVAAMQIEKRLDEFSELDKRRLARSLVRLLRDSRPEPAAAAHAALRKIADGDDYGPAPGATPAELAEAMREWNRMFSGSGDVSDERVAKGLLALAKTLEHKGRNEAAIQRYRDICERFPESAAAKEAQRQLESLEADSQ